MNIEVAIHGHLPNPEHYVVGYADMNGLLSGDDRAYPYAVVFARRLDQDIAHSIRTGPNRRYLEHYHALNRELSQLLSDVSETLQKNSVPHQAIRPTVPDQELSEAYFKTLRWRFSHKMAATRAGIGWIGKTDLLVTHRFGPRVRLATLLLGQPPAHIGTPIVRSQCGDCIACVTACPAKAANGREWEVGLDRDAFYNAHKCRETCRALSFQALQESISLCGICLAVCPKGEAV